MIVAVVGACGAMVFGGLFLLVHSLIGTTPTIGEPAGPATRPAFVDRFDRIGLRVASGVVAGIVLAVMTGWPVGTLLAALAGFLGPSLLGGKANRDMSRARLDAIATWTEQLRDVMAAASGLEQAVINTAAYAPAAIGTELNRLAAALDSGTSMRTALRRFAAQLDDPAGDLVVAALILAAEGSPRQLGDLLSRLATTSREEVKMRLRIETGRAQTRSSVKVVTAVTIAFSFGLVILNPEYVAAYRSVTGQLVLVAVAAFFGAAYWWLARSGRSATGARFLVSGDAPATIADRSEAGR